MTRDLQTGLLGESTDYADGYAVERLFPMPREEGRLAVGLGALPKWHGQDVWTGYEFSWLNNHGKPRVAVLRLTIDLGSSHIVESKSMKLYLNGYAQTQFDGPEQVRDQLGSDLGKAFGAKVRVDLIGLNDSSLLVQNSSGECLDDLDVVVTDYHRSPDLLSMNSQPGNQQAASEVVTESLTTHLFRSLCPVTAQPDWASVSVKYTGTAIDRVGLLKYLISYRQHQAFHETTVERIYADIWERCGLQKLRVTGRFVRRGGLDINPTRSSEAVAIGEIRLSRQ